MSNPFAFFEENDQEQVQQKTTQNKPKRTHQEKRQQKLENQNKPQVATSNVITQSLPQRVKENTKAIRNNRAPPTPQTKKLGEGHYLDRRSGTGRVDKPRKQGGGKGNIGNVKDELQPQKYIKQGQEQTQAQPQGQVPVEEVKPQPQALTLDEYYKSKGIQVTSVFEKKAPVKKTQVNAQWIKKEKLTVLETKQDKKNTERNGQNFVKFTTGASNQIEGLQKLGFGQKTAVKKPEQKKETKGQGKGKGKGKVVINDDDFPTL